MVKHLKFIIIGILGIALTHGFILSSWAQGDRKPPPGSYGPIPIGTDRDPSMIMSSMPIDEVNILICKVNSVAGTGRVGHIYKCSNGMLKPIGTDSSDHSFLVSATCSNISSGSSAATRNSISVMANTQDKSAMLYQSAVDAINFDKRLIFMNANKEQNCGPREHYSTYQMAYWSGEILTQ